MEDEEVPPRYRLGIRSIPAEDDDDPREAAETEPPEPPEPQDRVK